MEPCHISVPARRPRPTTDRSGGSILAFVAGAQTPFLESSEVSVNQEFASSQLSDERMPRQMRVTGARDANRTAYRFRILARPQLAAERLAAANYGRSSVGSIRRPNHFGTCPPTCDQRIEMYAKFCHQFRGQPPVRP